MKLRFTLGGLAAIAAGRAEAHAFDAGADAYGQVVEGFAVILSYPGLLLPILALGVLLSLWKDDGLPRVWPMFLLAQVAGVLAGAYLGIWVGIAAMAVGCVTAIAAALLPHISVWVAQTLAVATGLAVMASAFEGHGLFELSVFIHFGLLLGANMTVAIAAGLARIALQRFPDPWMRIAWRIVASWICAVLVLVAAFAVRGGVAT